MSAASPVSDTTVITPARFLRDCREIVAATEIVTVAGRLTRVAGLVLEASGLRLAVGTCCRVALPDGNNVEAEVVGFSEDRLFLMPVQDVYGLTPGALVTPLEAQPERLALGV